MNISVSVKQLGKRKPAIEARVLEIPNLSSPCQLDVFLQAVVAQQLMAFNQRMAQPEIVSFLLPQEIQKALIQGKLGFGERYNPQSVLKEEAQENVILAFRDGLFKVFLNEEEIELLSQTINFTSEDLFTFIRLTFLSGN